MNIREYQELAQQTDRCPGDDHIPRLIALLGLAGEAGSLLAEYKKLLRDGEAHQLFRAKIAEDLGDLLWYVANVAAKFDLDLSEIARANLEKTRQRWLAANSRKLFDEECAEAERLPRRLSLLFQTLSVNGKEHVALWKGDAPVGDKLTDNAYEPDGYAFHDAFHLAYMAVLGWSPVMRKLLKCKRKENEVIDEVEDGGRAQVIEEGAAALIFAYAKQHDFLVKIDALDFDLLQSLRMMTGHLEVRTKTPREWELAIFAGFRVWRELVVHGGGVVDVDLEARSIEYRGGEKTGAR